MEKNDIPKEKDNARKNDWEDENKKDESKKKYEAKKNNAQNEQSDDNSKKKMMQQRMIRPMKMKRII